MKNEPIHITKENGMSNKIGDRIHGTQTLYAIQELDSLSELYWRSGHAVFVVAVVRLCTVVDDDERRRRFQHGMTASAADHTNTRIPDKSSRAKSKNLPIYKNY